MSKTRSKNETLGRRAELIAELFLEGLRPEFVARSTADLPYDFLVGFRNPRGGVNHIGVEVKSTERLVRGRYPVPKHEYERLAYSNLPVLLLVVDVKENQLFYGWISPEVSGSSPESKTITVDLIDVDETTKKELRRQLAG
jgi:hypothetical protein